MFVAGIFRHHTSPYLNMARSSTRAPAPKLKESSLISRRQSKAKKQQIAQALLLHNRLLRQMAGAAEMRFPNEAYQKGWLECLRYLNVPVKEAQGVHRNIPATQSRQSSVTYRTDQRAPTE